MTSKTRCSTAPTAAAPSEHRARGSALGRDIVRIGEWANTTDTGDRDELLPGVSERAWGQVAVSSRECLGATNCPYGADCFAEAARMRAMGADVVVTNHALLAIDALSDVDVLPEHDVVVIDEAHELVDRVTGVATEELTAGIVERAAARCHRLAADEAAALAEAAAALGAKCSTRRRLAGSPHCRPRFVEVFVARARRRPRARSARWQRPTRPARRTPTQPLPRSCDGRPGWPSRRSSTPRTAYSAIRNTT